MNVSHIPIVLVRVSIQPLVLCAASTVVLNLVGSTPKKSATETWNKCASILINHTETERSNDE